MTLVVRRHSFASSSKTKGMKVLVVGASGQTGQHVVDQLIEQRIKVKVVVRSTEKIGRWLENEFVEVVQGNVLEMSDAELEKVLSDIHVITSTLGHNLSFKGIYGKPRRLVESGYVTRSSTI